MYRYIHVFTLNPVRARDKNGIISKWSFRHIGRPLLAYLRPHATTPDKCDAPTPRSWPLGAGHG